MSDQQIITGIALLGSGFSQLRCGISAYHWQITIYLVWFSSFTHLATLTFLRRYLYENVPLRSWRLGLMTVLIASLVIALIPTGNRAWLFYEGLAGIPAWCFFIYSDGDIEALNNSVVHPNGSMELSILVLVFSYATRAIKMFRWSSIRADYTFERSQELRLQSTSISFILVAETLELRHGYFWSLTTLSCQFYLWCGHGSTYLSQ
jgi:hypothetical protein